MKLVLLFDDRTKAWALIDEDIIAPTMGLSEEQHGRLVNPVDQTIGGDVLLSSCKASGGGE